MLGFLSNSEEGFTKLIKETEFFDIEKLSETHEITGFSCGNDKDDTELSNFLKENALVEQGQKINATYVAVLKGTKKVVGYVTTLNDRLIVSTKEREKMKISGEYLDFPALKIGRLAVDKRHERKHIGTTLFRAAVGTALESSGCRFLIVDSYPKSLDFYIKKGFVRNEIQNQKVKMLKEKADGSVDTTGEKARQTISLRIDLVNTPKE